jgi:hypothetical protein
MNLKPEPTELMLSHAWGGSVVETYNCLQNLVNHSHVPATTRVFYCTFSMYQAEDSAAGGLTIGQQLELQPFARIIESKPRFGMYVLHTTSFEVYSRMWTVHEVDEATHAGISMHGLFDLYRWSMEKFDIMSGVDTQDASCRPEDKAMLEAQIMARGGFQRLDSCIAAFRSLMRQELQEALQRGGRSVEPGGNNKSFNSHDSKFDWSELVEDHRSHDLRVVDWRYEAEWYRYLSTVAHMFNVRLPDRESVLLTHKCWSYANIDIVYPLGRASFPYGRPCCWIHDN